ncbi:unnamed protein product [Orchesella dallaii]|uniref:Sodium/calcium exchanger membrane region domain-containing protein n=1 Tax=Orchesella dallaii TaxID=48710 RepID=A0ABP1RCM4_9HEXA
MALLPGQKHEKSSPYHNHNSSPSLAKLVRKGRKVKEKSVLISIVCRIGIVYILSQIAAAVGTENSVSSVNFSNAENPNGNGDFPIFAKIADNNDNVSVILKATLNCTPPAIEDFPEDLFTQEERQNGFVILHILISLYIFYALSVVCDDYFVPSIERICSEFHVPKDVAGATFMAIATSSPELFTNVIGTFLTKGDIGVGTIVGSAVCNVLGVCACCGIAAKTALKLEWYPLTRDCLFYSFAVILLIVFLGDQQIFWYQALTLVLAYFVYILIMYKNASIKKWAENLVTRYRNPDGDPTTTLNNERTPLLKQNEENEITTSTPTQIPEADEVEEEDNWSLLRLPNDNGCFTSFRWVITWPARFAFAFTIPDCRKQKKLYFVTFFMCMVWIGASSYVVAWLVTIIGHTLSIPDSVMGLTFLAAGATTPEIVSSVIVVRQGHGTMGISNSLGSNTFDILLCLGLPWLIRTTMLIANDEPVTHIQINSGGFDYSLGLLLVAVLLLYTMLASNNFYLDKKVGFIALALYSGFILFACLFEMNVFFPVNLPVCDTNL